jgi:cytochrome c oxidase subunit II
MEALLQAVRRFFSFLFTSSSGEESDINSLFRKFLVMAAIMFLIVCFMVIAGGFRYRSKHKLTEPKQTSGNKRLEILWTLIPLLTLIIFFFLTIKTMRDIDQPFSQGQKPDIVIIAHQWWWDMRYPEYKIITANELHIPVGKRLLMRIESADVIHDWWVQDLGRKIDAIPGRLNYTWIEADTAGLYLGTCSEYCGMQHAWMRISVIAQPVAEFISWVKNQQQIPKTPINPTAMTGAKLFQIKTCGSCHAIAGTPAISHIGPDLSHLISRKTILSGMLSNSRENLENWLKDPQKIKEGAHMPNFLLQQDEINALVDYLEELK